MALADLESQRSEIVRRATDQLDTAERNRVKEAAALAHSKRNAEFQQRTEEAMRLKADQDAKVQQMRDEELRRRKEAELAFAAKGQARIEEMERARDEKRKHIDESIAKVRQLGEAGKTGEALVAYQALINDRDIWDYQGSNGAARLCGLGLGLFDAGRRVDDLPVATTALRSAVNLDSDSPEIVQHLLAFFEENKALTTKGDFGALSRNMAFIQGSGVEDHHLCVRNKQELSDLSLTMGWKALCRLNLFGAGAAVDAARELWDRNPRLGWLRNSISGAFLLSILLGLFAIAKFSEKAYLWLSNR